MYLFGIIGLRKRVDWNILRKKTPQKVLFDKLSTMLHLKNKLNNFLPNEYIEY